MCTAALNRRNPVPYGTPPSHSQHKVSLKMIEAVIRTVAYLLESESPHMTPTPNYAAFTGSVCVVERCDGLCRTFKQEV